MCEYTNDLMMAVTVGAAAFIGLTPVLFKQIAESGLGRCFKILLLFPLAISIGLGASSVVFAVSWLEVKGDWHVLWPQKLFAWEIAICSIVAIIFMFCRVWEIGRSKPATHSLRSRK